MIEKKYPANKPEFKKKCEIVGLFNSSNIQVTIYRVSSRLKNHHFSKFTIFRRLNRAHFN